MSNFVFLIDSNKTPMNPIHPAHARELLNAGKAAIFRRYPFVLIMSRVVENIVTYPLTLKIDPGSKFNGKRTGGKISEFTKFHSMDAYSYS